jgi:hypothetical protein
MKAIPLFLEEAPLNANIAFEVDVSSLTEATVDTPQAVALVNLGNGYLFEVISTQVLTEFEDTEDADFNSVTVQVGVAGDTASLLAAQQVAAKGTAVQAKAGTGAAAAPTVATDIIATFTGLPDTKALASLDKGAIRIFGKVIDARA